MIKRPFTRVALERYVDMSDSAGCWPWLGSVYGGYASYWDGERNRQASRLVYGLLVRPVEAEEVLRKRCEGQGCVAPHHHVPEARGEHLKEWWRQPKTSGVPRRRGPAKPLTGRRKIEREAKEAAKEAAIAAARARVEAMLRELAELRG